MDARIRIAARHSRMVRFLRVAVPATVIVSMAAFVFISVYNPFRMLLPKLPVDIGGLHLGNSLQASRRAVRPHEERSGPDAR